MDIKKINEFVTLTEGKIGDNINTLDTKKINEFVTLTEAKISDDVIITIDTQEEKIEHKFLLTILNLLKNNRDKIITPEIDSNLDSIISHIENILSKYRYNHEFIFDIIKRYSVALKKSSPEINYMVFNMLGHFELLDENIIIIRDRISDIIKKIVGGTKYNLTEIFNTMFEKLNDTIRPQIIEKCEYYFNKILTIKSPSDNQRGVGNGETAFYLLCAFANKDIIFSHPSAVDSGDIIINDEILDFKSFLSMDEVNTSKQVILSNKTTYTIRKKDINSDFSHVETDSIPIKLDFEGGENFISMVIKLREVKFWINNLPYNSETLFFKKNQGTNVGTKLNQMKSEFEKLKYNVDNEKPIYHRFLMSSSNPFITHTHRKIILDTILAQTFKSDKYIFIENDGDTVSFNRISHADISKKYKCEFNDNTGNFKIKPL